MTPQRAAALIHLHNYVNGMCLEVGAKRPDVPDMTVEEREYVTARTTYNTYSTLCEIAKGNTPATV